MSDASKRFSLLATVRRTRARGLRHFDICGECRARKAARSQIVFRLPHRSRRSEPWRGSCSDVQIDREELAISCKGSEIAVGSARDDAEFCADRRRGGRRGGIYQIPCQIGHQICCDSRSRERRNRSTTARSAHSRARGNPVSLLLALGSLLARRMSGMMLIQSHRNML